MKNSHRETLTAILFLLPNLSGFLVFTFIPVFASLILAFTEWNIFDPPEFVGIAHFQRILMDPDFWRFLWNTVYLMIGIPISLAGSLGLALLMKDKLPGVSVLRTLYFLPSVSSGVALFILWRWILNPDFGLLNQILMSLQDGILWGLSWVGLGWTPISPPGWLTSSVWAKPALILMGIWIGVGGPNMILYIAGLQQIPPELIEAAKIDGAGRWAIFRHITWPMLAPTTFFIVIMSMIGGLQGGFEQVYVMTDGGPAGATTTLSYYIYDKGFQWFEMGYASAVAWILFLMILVVTLIQWRYGRKAEVFFG